MFQSVNPYGWQDNVFSLLKKRWFILSAGTKESFNGMTCSWGGFGELFHKPVMTAYVRPQRHTKLFLDREERFTVSVLPESARKALNLYGTKSGKDMDKCKEAGLTPYFPEADAPSFAEAELILTCRKLLTQPMDPKNFLDDTIEGFYEAGDYHILYIGEIERILVRE